MRVGVDADGVIYNFHLALIKYLKEHAPGKYNVKHNFSDWYFYREYGMSDEEFVENVIGGIEAGIVFHGPARRGSSAALRRLRAAGHTVHIVTDRRFPGAQEATMRWLEYNRIPYDTLTFSADKTIVPTDVFIEDKPENADALKAAGVDVYLVTRPWNKHIEGHKRVSSISEFADKVLELS